MYLMMADASRNISSATEEASPVVLCFHDGLFSSSLPITSVFANSASQEPLKTHDDDQTSSARSPGLLIQSITSI